MSHLLIGFSAIAEHTSQVGMRRFAVLRHALAASLSPDPMSVHSLTSDLCFGSRARGAWQVQLNMPIRKCRLTGCYKLG
jgi:hypothetical protein